MFKRTDDGVMKNGTSQAQGRLNSILGDSSQMTGSMQIEGSVRIDGEFDGTLVASETVVVGRTGFARAEIQAREVMVAGRVRGKLVGSERVELQEGAHVEGDIFTESFVIADGVFFNGTCNMDGQVQQPADTTGMATDQSMEGDSQATMKMVESS